MIKLNLFGLLRINGQPNVARCLLGALLALAGTGQAFAATYYVSPTGSDQTGNGTLANPWFSLNKATYTMNGGDTVQMRGGTYYYTQAQYIWKGGSSNTARSIVRPYGTEVPTLDYTYTPKNASWDSALRINVNNVTVRGLRVVNSYYMNGIRGNASNVSILSCTVAAMQYGGIGFLSSTYDSNNNFISNIVIDGCTVVSCWQANNPGASGNYIYEPWYRQNNGGWGSALGIANANSVTVNNCRVYENYGEGINILRCSGANIKVTNNNYVSDNFSVNIYIDNVRGQSASARALVDRNTVDNNASNTGYWANLHRNGVGGVGIAIATEPYGSLTIPTAYISLTNNTVRLCSNGFTFGEYFNPVSYININGNTAKSSVYGGYVIGYPPPTYAPNATNLTWGTNYVNTTATSGVQPSGR
jgi:hypothetical protein